MILPLGFRQEARAEIREATDWYRARSDEAAEHFQEALATCLELIQHSPLAFPVVYRSLRRVHLRRFPYAILYRVQPEHIEIVACFHGRRHPRIWRRRA